MTKDYKLAYSTETGGTCPQCKKALRKCRCSTSSAGSPAKDQTVELRREKRKGKGVIVLGNIPYEKKQLKELCSVLKMLCGTGGTVKGATIEIQGENREAIMQELSARGLKYKWTGG